MTGDVKIRHMSTVGCKQKDGKTTVYIIKLSRDYVEAIDSIIVYCHHACIIVHASTCEGRRGGSLGIALVFVTLLSHLSHRPRRFQKKCHWSRSPCSNQQNCVTKPPFWPKSGLFSSTFFFSISVDFAVFC